MDLTSAAFWGALGSIILANIRCRVTTPWSLHWLPAPCPLSNRKRPSSMAAVLPS